MFGQPQLRSWSQNLDFSNSKNFQKKRLFETLLQRFKVWTCKERVEPIFREKHQLKCRGESAFLNYVMAILNRISSKRVKTINFSKTLPSKNTLLTKIFMDEFRPLATEKNDSLWREASALIAFRLFRTNTIRIPAQHPLVV